MLQTRIRYTVFVALKTIRGKIFDGLEIKFILPLGEIQQAGAPETAAKSVSPCFTFGY